MKRIITTLLAGAALAASMTASSLAQTPAPTDPATPPAGVAEHYAKAKAIAGSDPALDTLATQSYFCHSPVEGGKILASFHAKPGIVSTKLYDNVWQIGTPFVATIVLKTSAGLVVWDSLDNSEEVKTILEPQLRRYGLDVHDIKLVIVTHGHYDHFGGAKYLQDTYHTPIALSEADWKMVGATPLNGMIINNVPPPAKDKVLADGQTVTIGDATIKIVLTPGHTPGTVSSIVKFQEDGKPRTIAILGGTSYPTASPIWGEGSTTYPGSDPALGVYGNSIAKFRKAAGDAGATGLYNTHYWSIGGTSQGITGGAANVTKALDILGECVKAARLWNAAEQPKNS